MAIYMLIGLPASGKSSWAAAQKEMNPDVVIVSSDKIREDTLGSESDQSNNEKVFRIYDRKIKEAAKQGKDVIADATNLTQKRRIHYISEWKKYTNEIIGVLFAIPFDKCMERNQNRSRKVPKTAMKKLYYSFHSPHKAEGFSKIEIIRDNTLTKKELQKMDIDNIRQNAITEHHNSNHTYTCGSHCSIAYSKAAKNFEEADVLFAILYHDASKFKCKVFKNRKGERTKEAHFYFHENVSAYDFLSISSALLSFYDEQILEIAALINEHMIFFAGEKAIEKRKKLYGKEFFKKLETLHKYDLAAH